jgi:hypothetical protein
MQQVVYLADARRKPALSGEEGLKLVNRGQSLELFFIDGTPEGLLTAKIFNWTGHVLMAPRIRLAEALKRKEASYTGAYILIGDSEDSNLPRVYIGESEDVAERIRSHDAKRDWWTQVVMITSEANGLNKAHVKYLESRLVEEAKCASRMNLENANTPPRPSLSEAAEANMEQFVDYVLTILPALRIDGFIVKTRSVLPISSPVQRPTTTATPLFLLKQGETSAHGTVNATAQLQDNEFVVQPDSIGRSKWIGVEHNYQKLFDEVVESGVYIPEGSHRKFTRAYAFASPSAAGAVLNGRATAGPIAWVLASDPSKTYKQWEAEQLKK